MGRKARSKRVEAAPSSLPSRTDVGARPTTASDSGAVRDFGEPRNAPASTSANTGRVAAIAIALWVATAVAYLGSLATPFLLDDPINITKNPEIERPLALAKLLLDPRALVTASLRLNYLAGGFSVTGYHVLNIVAHAIAGTLVFLLARTTLRLPASGSPGVSAARIDALSATIALVFLLHPIQTESVTYVIQRAEIFVSAALAASLVAFARMQDRTDARTLAALGVACIAGAYSKPSFAVVPALLAVYDVCFLSRGRLAEVRRRWPAYAVAAAASVWTFVLTKAHGSFEANTAGFDISGITPADYLGAQFGVVVQYLRVTLWPARLCFDCGYRGAWPVHATFLGDSIVLPAIILLVIVAGSLALWRRYPLATFAVVGTGIVLSPTSSFVPLADFYVEHRMYLPVAFVAMALVPAADRAIGRVASGSSARTVVAATLAAVVLLTLATQTMARNRLLSDPVAMMEDSLDQAPNNERVQYNLANAYKRLGRNEDAIARYQTAIRIAPNIVRSYENLGSLYAEMGNHEKALAVWLAGAAAKPEVGMAHRNVATGYLRLGRAEEAFAAAKKSLEVDRGNPNGYRLLGLALENLGRTDEAAEVYREGLAVNPGNSTLAQRLAGLGQH